MRLSKRGNAVAFLLLSGCSLAPHYVPPATPAPTAYKEISGWVAATPSDDVPRGDWWKAFNDPQLDALEAQIDKASPTLAAAVARYDEARAQFGEARAGLFPTVTADANVSRDRLSATRPLATGNATYTDQNMGVSLAYELDLWGQVRNAVRAGKAGAQASAADMASVKLSLQAQLADAYFSLRGLDQNIDLLQRTVWAYQRAYDLTKLRHDGGIANGLDVSRAQTQLSTVKVQLSDATAQRTIMEHAIAALIGVLPSNFSLAPTQDVLRPPLIPVGVPSQLIQRRPDIAAAERRMLAANANIGVAKAAFFPSLTLGATGGYETVGNNLLAAPNAFWALGPASALLTLFDGGMHSAKLRLARATFNETSANYRSTVIAAFQDVEDNLSQLKYLGAETTDQTEAVQAARRTLDLAFTRYREGAADYLEVVTAQTAALQAEQTALTLHTSQLQTSVNTFRALGGGYS